jgi:hypothetical protein
MRGITFAIVLWSLLPAHSFSQRVAIHAGRGPATGFSGNFGLPPVRPIPPLGLTTTRFATFPGFGGFLGFRHIGFGGFGNFRRFGAFGLGGFGLGGFGGWGWGYPGFYDGYGYGDYYGGGNQPTPSVIVLMPPPQSPPPPPPEPARPEIHEYKQPDGAGGQPSVLQPSASAFSIVSRDGLTRYAIAVWVQDATVKYVGPDGVDGEVPLGSVDREATRRANAEKQLALQLPVPRASAQTR